jgi:hypothetical protein
MTRIGAIWETKQSTPEEPKYFMKLGQSNPKKPQYDLTVEVTVKDKDGNVVSQNTNGFLTIADPRKSQFASPNIPEKLQFDVLIGSNDDQG